MLSLGKRKHALVSDICFISSEQVVWEVDLVRNLNILKIGEYVEPLNHFSLSNISLNVPNLVSIVGTNGLFPVKSSYTHLAHPSFILSAFPWKFMWKLNVTQRINSLLRRLII